MNEGAVSAELGLTGWPAVAEESIIARDVLLAEHVGSRVHICHLSTAGSVEIVRWAKARGIQVTAEGLNIYNRDGLQVHTDPFALYPGLNVAEDGAHAFYLGVELARAQIAWQLGRRYAQDEELQWGAAVEKKEQDLMAHCAPGTTLQRKTKRRQTDAPPPADDTQDQA